MKGLRWADAAATKGLRSLGMGFVRVCVWVVHGSHDRTGIAGLDGFKVLTVGELEVAVISTFPDPEPASLGPRYSGPRLQ